MSRAPLAAVVGLALALAIGGDPATTAALLALALVLAAIAELATGLGVLSGRLAVAPVAVRTNPPVLTGRATDPIHHPHRPRAPGSC